MSGPVYGERKGKSETMRRRIARPMREGKNVKSRKRCGTIIMIHGIRRTKTRQKANKKTKKLIRRYLQNLIHNQTKTSEVIG